VTISESLIRAHDGFLGRTPSARQIKIYESFPLHKGVSSSDLDSEAFEAALILSLVQTYPKGQRPEPFKTYLFVRGSAIPWANAELETLTRTMFDYLKEQQKVSRARHLGTFFHAISMGSRALAFKNGPERWTAFGFEREDPTIPEWMREALLLETPA
jgi:hypothetical protein